ncbi:MAG: FkbM family methyltransferase [Methylobacteriaceae bacterium]|nr:FkbM family methyltransferase [Methylobacteriaceae bacterium]
MGLSWLVADGLRAALDRLGHDRAVKIARKIRARLDVFETESEPFASRFGPLAIGGVGAGVARDVAALEPETVRWIDAVLRDDDVLWDVGANVGLYSVYAARRGLSRVYAFEPFAATYLQLSRNLVANQVDSRVAALNLALSDRAGVAELAVRAFEPGFTSTLPGHEIARLQRIERIGAQSVLTLRAADFLAVEPAARPTAVKIDVDGAEALVLAGLDDALLAGLRTLLIEIDPEFAARFDAGFAPRLVAAGLVEIAQTTPNSGRNRIFLRGGGGPV